ncbi:porin family protein, partial [Vibrio sp.]|nr:porin family protein [Vibrio sp.]
MKGFITTVLSMFALLSMMQVKAEIPLYSGLGIGYADAEFRTNSTNNNGTSSSVNPILFQGQIGAFLNDHMAGELRYSTSYEREGQIIVDSVLSGLIKLNMPVSSQSALYGLAGFSKIELEHVDYGKNEEVGATFGLGYHYALDSQQAIALELINYSDDKEASLSNIG